VVRGAELIFLPSRDGLQASAARRELGFVITNIREQQRVLRRLGAGLVEEFNELFDAERFLIRGARATRGRETVGRTQGLGRSYGLCMSGRQGAKKDAGGDRKSGGEATERAHGDFQFSFAAQDFSLLQSISIRRIELWKVH
jgi:hypothetical protein